MQTFRRAAVLALSLFLMFGLGVGLIAGAWEPFAAGVFFVFVCGGVALGLKVWAVFDGSTRPSNEVTKV